MIFERKLSFLGLLTLAIACGAEGSLAPPDQTDAEEHLEVDATLDGFGEQPDLPVPISDVELDADADAGLGPDLEPDSRECDSGEARTQVFDCRGGESVEVNCPCIAGEFVCRFDAAVDCRPVHCDDGELLVCAEDVPLCSPGDIPARRQGCWACVDPETCEPRIPCDTDLDCEDHQHCGGGQCAVAPCESEGARSCFVERPTCADDEVGIIVEGCWTCVNDLTCEPYRGPCREDRDCGPAELCDPCGTSSCPECEDCLPECVATACATETERTCDDFRPECAAGHVAILDGGCWRCATTAECGLPSECREEAGFCTVGLRGCPEGSLLSESAVCLTLGDCCVPEDPLACARTGGACFPDDIPCPDGFIGDPSVICLPDAVCCSPAAPPERRCDDGSTLICEHEPPVCDLEHSELALVSGCWDCVNSLTCRSWGEPGCFDVRDCDVGDFCDFCGTASCPVCADCVPACAPTE